MAARKYNDKRHRERASLYHRSALAERWGQKTGIEGGKGGSFFVSNERELSYLASRRVAVDRLIAFRCENNDITELSKCLARRESIPLGYMQLDAIARPCIVAIANNFFLSLCPVLFSVLAAWTLRGSL